MEMPLSLLLFNTQMIGILQPAWIRKGNGSRDAANFKQFANLRNSIFGLPSLPP